MSIKKTGVVLCGGKSSRMGLDKARLIYKEKRFIEYAIESFDEFEEIILVTDKVEKHIYINDVLKKYKGISCVEDIYRDSGPLGGIYTSMKFSKYDDIVVVACDMPLLDKKITNKISKVMDFSQKDTNIIVFSEGKMQPLCSGYRKIYVDEIENRILSGKLKLSSFIESSKYKTIEVEERYTRNINYPDEYKKL